GLPRRGALDRDPDAELEERDANHGEAGEGRHLGARGDGRPRRDEEEEEHGREQERRHQERRVSQKLDGARPRMEEHEPHLPLPYRPIDSSSVRARTSRSTSGTSARTKLSTVEPASPVNSCRRSPSRSAPSTTVSGAARKLTHAKPAAPLIEAT